MVNTLNLLKENVYQVTSIKVQEITSGYFKVSVISEEETEHFVTIDQDFLNRFIEYKAAPKNIIKHSFEFLLDREPNTSILKEFNIKVIGSYFPEYPKAVIKYF